MAEPAQIPSVGRIVHYVGGEYPSTDCMAAIVTLACAGYPEADISACVLTPQGMFFDEEIHYSEDYDRGTWHWPERV